MGEVGVIGLALAKPVFQVHGADAVGQPVVRKQLRRGQVLAFFVQLSPRVVAMEGRCCVTLGRSGSRRDSGRLSAWS